MSEFTQMARNRKLQEALSAISPRRYNPLTRCQLSSSFDDCGESDQRSPISSSPGMKEPDSKERRAFFVSRHPAYLESGLPHASQLPEIPVSASLTPKRAISSRALISTDEGIATPESPRPKHTFFGGMAFLVAGLIAAAAAGYVAFVTGTSRPEFADARTSVQKHAQVDPVPPLPDDELGTLSKETEAERVYSVTESSIQSPSLQMLSAADNSTPRDEKANSGLNSLDRELPRGATAPKEAQDGVVVQDSTCLPSASAVRQNQPEAWPSWTLRAPGHQGIKCWYAATRTTAHDHRR
jgi:hypothetical protein